MASNPNSSAPIATNKFYTNMLLGNRTNPAYVEPYSVWVSKNNGSGNTSPSFLGLAISSTDDSQIVYGPDATSPTASYYFEPVGINSLTLSAAEFTNSSQNMDFHVQRCLDYSVQTYFVNPANNGQLWCPLVLGMGFVTGVYYRLRPVVSSQVGFASIQEKTAPQSSMRKYAITLNNGVNWVLYVKVPSGSAPTFSLSNDKTRIEASGSVDGTVVQVGRNPANNSDSFLDQAAGRFQTDAYITGSTTNGNNLNSQANVKFQYVAQGNSTSGKPLMFVPPHYEGVLTNMSYKRTNFKLRGPTLGNMYGYISTVLEFNENLPTNIGFLPYYQGSNSSLNATTSKVADMAATAAEAPNGADSKAQPPEQPEQQPLQAQKQDKAKDSAQTTSLEPGNEFYMLDASSSSGVSPYFSSSVADFITQVATSELNEDFGSQTNLDSMYFSGKGLDKFAFVVFVAKYMLNNNGLALSGLNKLKAAFAVFAQNRQINPLAYDTTWKGLVSTGGLSDPNADFGNTYYNDHHFHYGYFIHAAAVIAQVDNDIGSKTWMNENKDFVNSLVRDVANPTLADPFFPRFRSFDFFSGHSWAKGLFESTDGKDEESSSEDYHFAYGMKLWGRVTGDAAMESRGNIMLAVMRHSINSYMLFADDNVIVPSKMVKNKVSGICFENKVDYATYFGMNPEFIHGIHMIPITSVSAYIRTPAFVQQEWSQKLSSLAPSLTSGWKSVLYMNLALIDARASYNMFSSSNFSSGFLDGGVSRTWALAYAAYLGNM